MYVESGYTLARYVGLRLFHSKSCLIITPVINMIWKPLAEVVVISKCVVRSS